jgi:hypothetical protein
MRGIGVPLVAVALSAALAPAAQGANTWEGVWNTDFGRMTLDASGAGSYEGFSPGTITPNGPVGEVNEGIWDQGGDPPRRGPYRFVLSGGGQSFTGTWSYEQGGCGTACGWNGTCFSGACKENGVDGGGGGGGGCAARPLDLDFFAAGRADSCPRVVKFSFATRADALPDKPDKSQLPPGTVELEASSEDGRVSYGSEDYAASGTIRLDVADSDDDEYFINLDVGAEGDYVRNGDLRRVNFDAVVDQSSHPACDESTGSADGAFAVKNERVNLRLIFGGGCLSDQTILWKKARKFRRASIKVVRG